MIAEDKSKEVATETTARRVADLILDMGTYMLASGAHCGRLASNLSRMAIVWNYRIDLNPSFRGLQVTVCDIDNPDDTITSYKTSPEHSVHLSVLTDISTLSWQVNEKELSIDYVEEKFQEIKRKPTYPVWLVAIAIGFSCAGLCLFAFGDFYNALVAFVGASLGYLVRWKFSVWKFNSMITIAMAAFATTLISGYGYLNDIGSHPEAAMATAVLYLIPGVPLINTVIDLIEGYLTSSLNRAMFAGFTLLCIASGMTLCITILGISNFI